MYEGRNAPMKKQLLKTTAALALATAMIISPLTMKEARAAVNAEKMSFTTDLVMKKNCNVPNVTFNYTITKGEGKGNVEAPPANAKLPVITSSDTTPSTASQTFALAFGKDATSGNYDPTIDEDANDVSSYHAKFATTQNDDEKFVEKTVYIDFSNVGITTPGIYRYVLQQEVKDKASGEGVNYDLHASKNNNVETRNLESSYDNDAAKGSGTRYIDLYVTQENDSSDVQYRYLMHTSDTAYATSKTNADDKSAGFINIYDSYDLTITKQVTGNQGNKNDYFKFRITLNNENVQKTVNIDLSKASQSLSYKNSTVNNPTSLTINNNTSSADFYLKDGQSVTIKGISWHAGYIVNEDETDASEKSYEVAAGFSKNSQDKVSNNAEIGLNGENYSMTDTLFAGDSEIIYTNSRQGNVPTGVIMSVLPGLAVVAVGAIGIIYFARKKKRHI
jgi:hypothetical protein